MPTKSNSAKPITEHAADQVIVTSAAADAPQKTTRGRKKPAGAAPAKPRAKSAPSTARSRKPQTPPDTSATLAAELSEARHELADVTAACREAQSRLTLLRTEAEQAAAEVRAVAEAAEQSRAQTEQVGDAVGMLARNVDEVRDRLARLEVPPPVPEGQSQLPPDQAEDDEVVDELPRVEALAEGERAEDLPERVVRLLNDAWGVEKEQVDLLQTLADDSGDRELRVQLEAHRADCQERQHAIAARLEGLGASPAGGRGLLGQLVSRIWDAVQSPRDQADQSLLAVLKALSTAEFQAALYAALHAAARCADDGDTADLAAACYRQERDNAAQLRAALAPTVGRAARR
ncbi:MAG TPA: DUF892 family protein [Gemmata sp.]|nr:DUF892 family protein [Gemmata sp.]